MEAEGAFNEYACDTCRGRTRTVNRDAGTTPFLILCRASPDCHGTARSMFYRCEQSGPAPWRWILPSPEELDHYVRTCGAGSSRAALEVHVEAGGMILVPADTA